MTHSSDPRFPSGRYHRSNPLRRLFGLRLLAEPLPEPLRDALIWTWMIPARYDGNQAIPSAGARASAASENAGTQFPQAPAAEGSERQRLPDDVLPFLPPRRLGWMTFIELAVGRRIVEVPRTEIDREERNKLLRAQAAYLHALYVALVQQIGEAAALAQFQQWLLAIR